MNSLKTPSVFKLLMFRSVNMAVQAYLDFERNNSPDDVEAYRAVYGAYKGGQTREEIAEYYNKWAEGGLYDVHLNPERYKGPEITAQAIATNYDNDSRKNVRILDVAAGTGRLGAELYRLGFRNLDALDPSQGMLSKAMQRNIYRQFYSEFLDAENQTSIPDNTYDGLTCAGGMGEGHIPSLALIEMIRIVKPGGIICLSVRAEYLEYVADYKENLIPLMEKLQGEGKWKKLSEVILENYAMGKTGKMFQFKVY